jgi:hypothetical protein
MPAPWVQFDEDGYASVWLAGMPGDRLIRPRNRRTQR